MLETYEKDLNKVTNLKQYVIEFQGKKLCVIDQIELNNETYLITLDLDNTEETVIVFLKKKSTTIYEYIDDDKTCNKILAEYGLKIVSDDIEKIQRNMNN